MIAVTFFEEIYLHSWLETFRRLRLFVEGRLLLQPLNCGCIAVRFAAVLWLFVAVLWLFVAVLWLSE